MFEYINDARLKFAGTLTKRTQTDGIVIHHLAGRGLTVGQLNAQEIRDNGWKAIGYNIYIRQDGSAWWGRGLEYVGSHAGRKAGCKGYEDGAYNNSRTIGIGCEGYYHPSDKLKPDTGMPAAQYATLLRVCRDLNAYYGGKLWIKGHKEMPGTNTVCPGNYFPLAALKSDVLTDAPLAYQGDEETAQAEEPSGDISVYELQEAMLRDGIALPRYGADGKWGAETEAAARKALVRQIKPWINMDCAKLVQYALGGLSVDGKCGSKTTAAIKRYQAAHGLVADGIVGINTWKVLCGID